MPINPADIRVAITGAILSAPVGTAFPADISVAPAAAFADHGLTTPDGITLTPNIDSWEVEAWQSASPVRRGVRRRAYDAKFKLLQTSRDNIALAHGGGTWTGAAGKFVYNPPAGGTSDERAWIFQYTDGAFHYRYCVPRATLSSLGDLKLVNNDALGYDCTVSFIGDDWYLQTDDPAADPASLVIGGGGEGVEVDPNAQVNETPTETPTDTTTTTSRRGAAA